VSAETHPNATLALPVFAATCYEAVRAYAWDACGDGGPFHADLGPWPLVSPDVRRSWTCLVEYALLNPELSPEELHNGWAGRRQSEGWSYGSVFDEAEKRDPRVVPHHQLALPHRRLVLLVRAIVGALLAPAHKAYSDPTRPAEVVVLADALVFRPAPRLVYLPGTEPGKLRACIGTWVPGEEGRPETIRLLPQPERT